MGWKKTQKRSLRGMSVAPRQMDVIETIIVTTIMERMNRTFFLIPASYLPWNVSVSMSLRIMRASLCLRSSVPMLSIPLLELCSNV